MNRVDKITVEVEKLIEEGIVKFLDPRLPGYISEPKILDLDSLWEVFAVARPNNSLIAQVTERVGYHTLGEVPQIKSIMDNRYSEVLLAKL